ncbi:hypothetical protein RHA1_ro08209 (plasmid) [Rhodococcus jostii RHA1]|uniref:DUF3263 domain-containing protein n=1 Tax=Rhodococcus jostii (strain RHA1) TaxID=101510 RepID=Q0RZN2_RHOJR|nr:hypothetical protein RHA1_ro08209 [Rhodococcus jostii RHA1]
MPEHPQREHPWTRSGWTPDPRTRQVRREHEHSAIEADVRKYRQRHRQRTQSGTTRHRPGVVRDETEAFLSFADIWAPFGGPPEAELFVTYGITKSTFSERLWHILASRKCDRSVAQRLWAAYPPPSR